MTTVPQSESEQWKGLINSFGKVKEALEISYGDSKRREKELKSNKRRIDETKKIQFYNMLDKVLRLNLDKPNLIKKIFEDNGIDTPEFGFTLTEMAMAYIEHEGLQHQLSLDDAKLRIRNWLYRARKNLSARFTYKEINGRTVIYLAKQSEDLNNPIEKVSAFVGKLLDGYDGRKALKSEMQKEEEELKVEEPEPIVIDTEGNPTSEEENTNSSNEEGTQ